MNQLSSFSCKVLALGCKAYSCIVFGLLCLITSSSIFAQEPSIQPPSQVRPQRALDLSKKFGVSILTIANEQSALGINWGLTSNSFLEIAMSSDWRQPSSREAESQFYLSAGGHLQLIQARDIAALTLGGRLQLSYSELCYSDTNLCADRSIVTTPTPQYKLDIPLRIYWFPNPYISIHSEIGIDITWGESGASEGEAYLSGYRVSVFNRIGEYGKLGLTLWF